MSRLTRDGTAEPVSRDHILRHARGQGNVHFPCSADHEQDWQPYPVDPYSAVCDDHTYIHTYHRSAILIQYLRICLYSTCAFIPATYHANAVSIPVLIGGLLYLYHHRMLNFASRLLTFLGNILNSYPAEF